MVLENDNYVYPGQRFTGNGLCTGHGQGMTLRDWFAGQALSRLAGIYSGQAFDPNNTAISAYVFADAMLSARNNNTTEHKDEQQ